MRTAELWQIRIKVARIVLPTMFALPKKEGSEKAGPVNTGPEKQQVGGHIGHPTQ